MLMQETATRNALSSALLCFADGDGDGNGDGYPLRAAQSCLGLQLPADCLTGG